jgi:hypothetical protein
VRARRANIMSMRGSSAPRRATGGDGGASDGGAGDGGDDAGGAGDAPAGSAPVDSASAAAANEIGQCARAAGESE